MKSDQESGAGGKPPSDQNRRTPQWLFKLMEQYLDRKFVCDTAANKENALCRRFFDEAKNGLEQTWPDGSFNNPPFKKFGLWAEKAYTEAAASGAEICQVGPVGASQSWFHKFARCGTILVPTERIIYMGSTTGEPTPGGDRDSMIFLYGERWWNPDHENSFRVLPLDVSGLVVRSQRPKKAV